MADEIQPSRPRERKIRRSKRRGNTNVQQAEVTQETPKEPTATSIRRAKRKRSGRASSVKNAQRCRKRARRRGEVVVSDMQQIIRRGPSSSLSELRLPTMLTQADINDVLRDNLLLQDIADHFHEMLYDNICGKGRIDVRWSDRMHELSIGEQRETLDENQNLVYYIEICRTVVRTKELIYLVLLHELAHCVTTASSVCEHRYHGNAFLKVLEKLYHWDKHADFYSPARQAQIRMPFVYRCQDDYCGKRYERKKPLKECRCREGLVCLRVAGKDIDPKDIEDDCGIDGTESTEEYEEYVDE